MSGTLAIEGEDFERLLTEIQRYGDIGTSWLRFD